MRSLLLVLAAAGLAACGGAPDPPPTVAEADAVAHVSGLACERCAASLANALGDLDGVEGVAVDLDERDQRARIDLAPGSDLSEAAVREAVADAGFVFRSLSTPDR